MSRIGKLPVAIPEDVNVELTDKEIVIKGKLGELRAPLTNNVVVAYNDNQVTVLPKDNSNQSRAQWGTSRSNIANMVKGVTDGYEKELEITGVGYRASVDGKFLKLALGFSHDILVLIPEDITIKCPKQTEIIIAGMDNQKVGQVAAKIREFRPPEPYKGKGIKYKGEQIRRKEGKKK